MKKIFFISLLLISLILLAGCMKNISDVKSEEYLDEVVSVRGTVENTIKLGELSGYTLMDSSGESIFVSSKELPAEGAKKSVRGEVKKFLGSYYLETK